MANSVRPEFTPDEIIEFLVSLPTVSGEKRNINITPPELHKICVVDFDATVHNNLENMRIKANGNIRFLGTVTNCSLLAGGKVELENECSNSVIHAQGDVSLRIGRFSDIYSEQNVSVGVESHNCILSAGNAIHAENATIYGGKLSAFAGIRVGRAFKPNDYVSLTLALRGKELVLHKQAVLTKQIQIREKAAEELKQTIQNTIKRLLAEKKFNGVHPEIEALKLERLAVEKQVEQEKAELQKLQKPQYDTNTSIKVDDRISQGGIIEIGNLRSVNSSTLEKVEFYTDGKRIETRMM